MNYNIKIMPSAIKFLKKQDRLQQERLLKSIKNLPSNGDIKQMKGYGKRYRLRVDDYRIIYEVDNFVLIVIVLEIGNRGDIYK